MSKKKKKSQQSKDIDMPPPKDSIGFYMTTKQAKESIRKSYKLQYPLDGNLYERKEVIDLCTKAILNGHFEGILDVWKPALAIKVAKIDNRTTAHAYYSVLLPAINGIIKDCNKLKTEYEKIKGWEVLLKEKDREHSKLNTDYHKLRKELESKIEDFKVKLSGKTSEVNQLEDRLSYEVEEKNTWIDIYHRNVAKWRIESLEDEEYAYFASWRNPITNKVEKYEIPRDFNPHSKLGMHVDDNDFYKIDYYSEIDDIVVNIHIPISLFEELKKKIEPKKTTQIKSLDKNKKRILVKVDDLNQIKKIYADNGKASKTTPIMEIIAKHFLKNRGIPFSTGDIQSLVKCDPKTCWEHLTLMCELGIIEKLSFGKWRIPSE